MSLTPDFAKRLHLLNERRDRFKAEQVEARRESRSLYSNDAGLPVLRKSYVIYLDALGTKERASNLTNEQLRRSLDDLDELDPLLHDNYWNRDHQRLLSFTDNVVLGAPWIETYLDGGLTFHLDSVARYQLDRVCRGAVLRGGIALGEAYLDDHHADGAGLVQAVLLEEREAIFPRVLLSAEAVNVALIDAETESSPRTSALNSFLVADADGEVFVNYLYMVMPMESNGDAVGLLDAHRTSVENGLKKAKDPRRRAKWEWMADYHDFFITTFAPNADSARIAAERSTRRFPRHFQRLIP